VGVVVKVGVMVVCACHPSDGRKPTRRVMVQASLGKKQDPISKIARAKSMEVWFKQ
jgi:hypothetical protein